MESNTEFSVDKVDSNIILKHIITREMSLIEAHKELEKLRGDQIQVEQQIKKTEKQIEDDVLGEQLIQVKANKEKLLKLETNIAKLVEPVINEIKKKLIKKVKEEKIKRGYERVNDIKQKFEIKNQILGPLLDTLNVDIESKIAVEVRRDFDKI